MDVLFLVLSADGNKSFKDINKDILRNLKEASKKYRTIDEEIKDIINTVLSNFFDEYLIVF